MERQEFIERCNYIFKMWCADDFQKNVEKLLASGAIDLENVDDSYKDCYPVVAAILERVVDECVNGSSYEKTRKEQKKAMNNYLKFI